MSIIGKALAWAFKFGAVQEWLGRDTYGHLYNSRGMYMGRWAVIREGTVASKVLALLTAGRYDHVRLHWINQPDADRELHNHPFKYRTFILRGWYEEEVGSPGLPRYTPRYRSVRKGDTAAGGGYHRIAGVSPGGVFTLFFMGKDTGEWGFLVNGKHVTSKEFFKLRGIRADGNKA